ncbi:MAG: DoxX family membrane protein [Verrucomicrobiota bacterium]
MSQEQSLVSKICKISCPMASISAETWAFWMLRLFLGLRFLTAGVGKFIGPQSWSFSQYVDKFVTTQLNHFAMDTFLPKFLLAPYLHSLAYIEILLGICLLLGIKTKCSLVGIALLSVSIAFGMMLLPPGQGAQTAHFMGIYVGLAVAGLLLHKHNKFELCKCCDGHRP